MMKQLEYVIAFISRINKLWVFCQILIGVIGSMSIILGWIHEHQGIVGIISGALICLSFIFLLPYNKSFIKWTKNKTRESYISLKQAAIAISEIQKITDRELHATQPFASTKEEWFKILFETNEDTQENNDTHDEILDERTILYINRILHFCEDNFIIIAGRKTPSPLLSPIKYKDMKYFNSDYTVLFSDIRKQDVLYTDIRVDKHKLFRAIQDLPYFDDNEMWLMDS